MSTTYWRTVCITESWKPVLNSNAVHRGCFITDVTWWWIWSHRWHSRLLFFDMTAFISCTCSSVRVFHTAQQYSWCALLVWSTHELWSSCWLAVFMYCLTCSNMLFACVFISSIIIVWMSWLRLHLTSTPRCWEVQGSSRMCPLSNQGKFQDVPA